MLRASAFKPRKQNAPRPAWKVAEAFKQWLRGRPCACGGKSPHCMGPIQSAHVPVPGEKGISTKVADRHCIPLSYGCHELQHKIGWVSFTISYLRGSDPLRLSDAYWRAWPGRAKWEASNA